MLYSATKVLSEAQAIEGCGKAQQLSEQLRYLQKGYQGGSFAHTRHARQCYELDELLGEFPEMKIRSAPAS